MMTFRNNRLRNLAVPMSTNWLLNDLAEAKGKQELYTRQAPPLLKALRETALVQSVESSRSKRRAAQRPSCCGRRLRASPAISRSLTWNASAPAILVEQLLRRQRWG